MSGRFLHGHAAHADWREAAETSVAQMDAQRAEPGYAKDANLGFIYFTERLSRNIDDIIAFLKEKTGVSKWVGTVGIGIAATGVEYLDRPALAVMLADLPEGEFQVFSGIERPPEAGARTASGALALGAALVHADAGVPDLVDLLGEFSARIDGAKVFGGLSSSRIGNVQVANQSFEGGLSGAVFSTAVALSTKVSQGCHPMGPVHVVTQGESHLITLLDARPSLDVLLEDCVTRRGVDPPLSNVAILDAVQGTMCALFAADDEHKPVRWEDATVRHVAGIDPDKRLVAIAGEIENGMRVQFCTRNADAARRDLVRICTALRAELEDEGVQPRGAVFVSCVGRGANLFGTPSAELAVIKATFGELPVVGFYASGEIAGSRLLGYTGVLTVFR